MIPHDAQGRSPEQQEANERAAIWIFFCGIALVCATALWVIFTGGSK